MFILEILKAIVLGIVQGITEWLPISSTGHMIIFDAFMHLSVYADEIANKDFVDMFLVVIQFGSILAVVLLYFNRLNPFSPKKSSAKKKQTWTMWLKILVAAIPAGVVGILFDDMIDALLYNPTTVAVALIVYGIAFILIERQELRPTINTIDEMDYLTALKIGAFQMLALIPGTSRSGSTILGATLVGCSRSVAAEFSFFLAIPVMLGASLVKLIKMKVALTFGAIVVLLIGMIVAFVVSVVVIRFFMKFIRKHDFQPFGYYRIALGIIVLIMVFTKVIA